MQVCQPKKVEREPYTGPVIVIPSSKWTSSGMGVENLKLEHVYFVKTIGPVFYSNSTMAACASIDVLQSLFILRTDGEKAVFSPVQIEGIWGTHILGGANVHIKAFGSTPIPHQSKTSIEGIWGQYPLSMLGRTLKGV